MTYEEYKAFKDWREEKPETRFLRIELSPERHGGFSVWAYDYTMCVGQIVKQASEINLEGKKENELRAKYEELKAMFAEA